MLDSLLAYLGQNGVDSKTINAIRGLKFGTHDVNSLNPEIYQQLLDNERLAGVAEGRVVDEEPVPRGVVVVDRFVLRSAEDEIYAGKRQHMEYFVKRVSQPGYEYVHGLVKSLWGKNPKAGCVFDGLIFGYDPSAVMTFCSSRRWDHKIA